MPQPVAASQPLVAVKPSFLPALLQPDVTGQVRGSEQVHPHDVQARNRALHAAQDLITDGMFARGRGFEQLRLYTVRTTLQSARNL